MHTFTERCSSQWCPLPRALTPQPEALAIVQQQEQWLSNATLTAAGVQDKNLRKAILMSLCATGARHMAGTVPPSYQVPSQHISHSQNMEI